MAKIIQMNPLTPPKKSSVGEMLLQDFNKKEIKRLEKKYGKTLTNATFQ